MTTTSQKLLIVDSDTTITSDFSPPTCVHQMTALDRDLFKKTVHVPSVLVPQADLNTARKKLWKYVLRIPKVIPVTEHCDAYKAVILDPKYLPHSERCDPNVEEILSKLVDLKQNYRVLELNLTYENWTADDVLEAVLPEGEKISGFTVVGHIAHFNLKTNHAPYKQLIGQVILDKIKNIRTVVNKLDAIDSVYRFFQMELLAGEEDTVALVKENGCSFKFDFAKVYWNSRLGTEHERIVSTVQSSDILYDVFAGVGPFAVPCARKNCTVIANDLNPESFRWLNENVKLNGSRKYPCAGITTHNLDGREFIMKVLREDLLARWQKGLKGQVHIVMNLPALAVEFLDAFRGIYDEVPIGFHEPMVHCYTFSKEPQGEIQETRTRVEDVLGERLPEGHVIRHVRNVAPNKDMLCVAFRLSSVVLCAKKESEEPEQKRPKLDES